MIGLRYPIMMGLGTKILTAYHHPSFKTGLMIAILNSKKKNTKGKSLTEKEFRSCASSVVCEMHFGELEDLDRYITNLQVLREQWKKEVRE